MSIGSKLSPEIEGRSLLGSGFGKETAETFTAFNPRTGEALEPRFHSAEEAEVTHAVMLANAAATSFADLSNKRRAGFLNAVAENLESVRAEIVKRASLETGLPEARFEGELGRTCGQLRMFADVALEGSWVDARIDRAIPGREPLPKPDIRSMLMPLGPVVVFCASNFPLAFSVAGGDTASALASGCPVIVVAHTAHPGTAELAGRAIAKAVNDMGLEEGVFSLIFSTGYDAGQALVRHPLIKAVGFTGSRKGGKSLSKIAGERDIPIPVFAEMSSVNPVFLLPEAMNERAEAIAEGLFASFTLGYGQFCTKPGIVVLRKGEAADAFVKKVETLVESAEAAPLLTSGICSTYLDKTEGRDAVVSGTLAEGNTGNQVPVTVSTVAAADFLDNSSLSDEVFGPSTLIVLTDTDDDIIRIAAGLEGQLTATVHAAGDDLHENAELVRVLRTKAGRLVLNSFPTGVEVCGAMVHGGPFPATTDARTTSVGKRAIGRFTKLVAFQGFPDEALPSQLRDSNPCNINRIEE